MEITWSSPSGYEALVEVLKDAIEQAAEGKGAERHSTGEPFIEQPMMVINGWVGDGFSVGQGIKKCQEASMFFKKKEYQKGEVELLGAINYLAGAVLWSRDQRSGNG